MEKLFQKLYIPQLSLLLSMIFCCNSSVILCDNFLPQALTLLVAVETVTCIFLATSHFLKIKGSQDLFWDNLALISVYLVTINDTTALILKTGLLTLLLGFVFLTLHCIINVITWRPRKHDSRQEQEEQKQGATNVPWLLKIAFLSIGNGAAISGRLSLLGNEKSINVSMFVGGAVMFAVSVVFFYCYYCFYTNEETGSNAVEDSMISVQQDIKED